MAQRAATVIEDGESYVDAAFAGVDMTGQTLSGVTFDGCSFTGCTFMDTVLHHCVFTDCAFTECDLSNAKVPNARFVDARFAACKLIGIDWTVTGDGSISRLPLSVSFERCVLSYASFFGLQLRGLPLRDCTAHEADFREAILVEADCRGTDFKGSSFGHTDLSRANFTDARRYAIDPTMNTIRKARFSLPEAVSLLHAFDVVVE